MGNYDRDYDAAHEAIASTRAYVFMINPAHPGICDQGASPVGFGLSDLWVRCNKCSKRETISWRTVVSGRRFVQDRMDEILRAHSHVPWYLSVARRVRGWFRR